MKKTINYLLAFFIFLVTILFGCKKEKVPVITTTEASNITVSTATSGGNIIDAGSSPVTSLGVCWSTTANPATSDSKTSDGIGTAQFVSSLSGLAAGTTYHVRAYAVNSAGISYGEDMSFLTLGQLPSTVTQPATNVTVSVATLNGTVNANHLSTTVTFEYGGTISYGSAATALQSPVTGNAAIIVSGYITGLAAGTTYHFRVKTVNAIGTVYGDDLSFTTLGQAPAGVTQAATNILTTGATLNGTVNANYINTYVTFEYGTTISYGSTAVIQSTVTGNTITNVSANITGLAAATIYHYRIKALNSLGTSYGSDVTFTTSVTDEEGNVYKTIKIGTQVWMAENLKSTKYRNGNLIGTTTPSTLDISLETAPKYQWAYAGNENNAAIYGRLYTWYAVTDSRNVCPTGWHVPSDDEWTILITYLGGTSVAGGKLKETGTTHWQSPNMGATNETGFTALPGGDRYSDGSYYYLGGDGSWWSSKEGSAGTAWYRYMVSSASSVNSFGVSKKYGFSVRCLRDF